MAMRVPQNGIRENPIKMDDDWGYPHLWKPPCKKQHVTLNMFENTPLVCGGWFYRKSVNGFTGKMHGCGV